MPSPSAGPWRCCLSTKRRRASGPPHPARGRGVAAFGAAVTDPILLLGGLGWAGLYLLLGVSFGGVGGGDVKLGLSLGILAAAAGGTAAWFVAVLGASVVTVLRGALTRRKAVALGPSMLLSTAFAVGMWFGA
ncbi:hypothetical protein QP028_15065 [Corynebacterium suedekumii]|nr:hypothetical protein QP028_15065 [Corynebacterium suedekumii]